MAIDPEKLVHRANQQALRDADKTAKRSATHFQEPHKTDEELEARLVILRANDLAERWRTKFGSDNIGFWEMKRRFKMARGR